MLGEKIKELLSQKEIQQFIRFCIVGGTCAMIDAAIFYIVRLFAPYQVALISGYLMNLRKEPAIFIIAVVK